MTRYRLLSNGDHWCIQKKSPLWPFWRWVRESSMDWDDYHSWIVTFATDTEARAYVEQLKLTEDAWDKRHAPYTIRVYL